MYNNFYKNGTGLAQNQSLSLNKLFDFRAQHIVIINIVQIIYALFQNICQYSIMSVFDDQQENRDKHAAHIHRARQQKFKEIQTLYREQIRQIYDQSRSKIQSKQQAGKIQQIDSKHHYNNSKKSLLSSQPQPETKVSNVESLSTINFAQSKSARDSYPHHINKQSRPSIFVTSNSTKTFETRKNENQSKELTIRQLTNQIKSTVNKLRRQMKPEQFETQMKKLRQFSDDKMERLQNLFKIKNQEIFFKIKMQIVGLLQEFGVGKQQLAEAQEVVNESTLVAFMTNKLKGRLRDFKYQEQETHFSIQQDKILGQKQEQRIHYLVQTNQLLRLSESKLKNKIEDLKVQLNNFLQLIKQKQKENEQRQTQAFRLKKQLQQSNRSNQRLQIVIKDANIQKLDEQRTLQAKINDMKSLLNNYFAQKNKLSSQLEQKDGQIQEVRIKLKFLEQENERLNRELVRWKERYDWLQKEQQNKYKEILQDYNHLATNFQKYKEQYNQGNIMLHKTQTSQALQRVKDYQMAYEQMISRLEHQKNLFIRAEEQNQEKLEREQSKWRQKIKELQALKEEEILEISNYNQIRQTELKKEYEKKSALQVEEMEAHMKTFLAEKDKESIQEFIKLEGQNEQLRREIQNLHKVLSVKQSLINVISNKKLTHD